MSLSNFGASLSCAQILKSSWKSKWCLLELRAGRPVFGFWLALDPRRWSDLGMVAGFRFTSNVAAGCRFISKVAAEHLTRQPMLIALNSRRHMSYKSWCFTLFFFALAFSTSLSFSTAPKCIQSFHSDVFFELFVTSSSLLIRKKKDGW